MIDPSGHEHRIQVTGNVAHLQDIGWALKIQRVSPANAEEWDVAFGKSPVIGEHGFVAISPGIGVQV
jgi:hypothetical protein